MASNWLCFFAIKTLISMLLLKLYFLNLKSLFKNYFFSIIAYSLSLIHNVNFRVITGFPKNLVWTRLWQGLDKTRTALLNSVKMLVKWRLLKLRIKKEVGQVVFLTIYAAYTWSRIVSPYSIKNVKEYIQFQQIGWQRQFQTHLIIGSSRQ